MMTPRESSHRVAVIGMAGRFPGARNVAEFWRNLRGGVESIRHFSDEELLESGVEPSLLKHPKYVKAGGVLDDADRFDAAFFGYTPGEAEVMDPQQRVFLETAWEALESAAYAAPREDVLIGVYAGSGFNTYLLNNFSGTGDIVKSLSGLDILLGNDKDFLSTRVSYKLNLKGPSICIQTACSTSLVAVCEACRSLLAHQCDIALAGGVSIGVPLKAGCFYQEGGITSPDGHCRAFDAKAQGMVAGHGAGVVVLKRLAEAVRDGDVIHAVISGFAVSNDGGDKIGYTAPSIEGQAEVIALAHALADVDPSTIGYVEAHGTGTILGDPIEISALTEAFRTRTDRKRFCALGSVKTNVGHLNTAAGVAGLIKTVLALRDAELPPSLNFEKPNPKIDFASSPFYVNTKLKTWDATGMPRRAGVSSFGMGGTNAHVVLEEAPVPKPSGPSRPAQLLVLSAKSGEALDRMTSNLAAHLTEQPNINLADVAYSLKIGRDSFAYRRFIICRDRQGALESMSTKKPKQVYSAGAESLDREIVFMFPGQGAQYPNMARELYETEPVYRSHIDRGCELLRSEVETDLSDILFPPAEQTEFAAKRLEQTCFAQPALFLVEFALSQLWIHWGVRPACMIGHSIGEWTAACLAGVFNFEDALRMVALRGRLMQAAPPGSMTAVPLARTELELQLQEGLSIAAVNELALCVATGPTESIERFERQLAERGITCRRLHTSHAFHSAMMDGVTSPFVEALRGIRLSAPAIPFISNVSGTWITPREATSAEYWGRQLRQPVLFAAGMGELFRTPDRVFLEVGPGVTLSTLASRHPAKSADHAMIASVRHPLEQRSDSEFLLQSLGRAWLCGTKINWTAFYEGECRRRVTLPTYPFERRRYWVTRGSMTDTPRKTDKSGRLSFEEWFHVPSWTRSASASPNLYLSTLRTWLLFADDCGVAEGLEESLRRVGHEVSIVTPGERFSAGRDSRFTINPRRPEDYEALFDLLAERKILPSDVVHCWNVASAEKNAAPLENLEGELDLGLFSLMHLVQAVARLSPAHPLRCSMVTTGLFDVLGDEVLSPVKATLLGLSHAIPLEFPGVTCRLLDIEPPQSRPEQKRTAIKQLLAEMDAPEADSFVAYRGRHRWIRSYEPVRLLADSQAPHRLREQGVYLITGGLGGIGLTLAEFLARTVRAKLVLAGRSGLSPFDATERRLGNNGSANRKAEFVRSLEALGAEVMIAQADVTDAAQVNGLIKNVFKRFGAIHGIVHSAGVPGGGLISRKTRESVWSNLGPKVRGTLNLSAATKDIPLDFVVYCSSLASVLGGVGQSIYSSANAFQDHFALSACSMGKTPTFSINWDGWSEVGMAVAASDAATPQERREADLPAGIRSTEGVEAFRLVLASAFPQVVVSTRDLHSRLQKAKQIPVRGDSDRQSKTEKASNARPTMGVAYSPPRTDLERTIATLCEESMSMTPIGIHDNLLDLGAHSLLVLRIISRLNDALHVELPLARFFDGPTVAQIAENLEKIRLNRAADDDALADVIQMVDGLSDEEVRQLLSN